MSVPLQHWWDPYLKKCCPCSLKKSINAFWLSTVLESEQEDKTRERCACTLAGGAATAGTNISKAFLNYLSLVHLAEKCCHKEVKLGQLPECFQILG